MKPMKLTFNAIVMQYLLLGTCFVIIGGIVWISIAANDLLTAKAMEVDHRRTDAELAQEELVGLDNLRNNLDNNADVVNKTKEIVATAEQYHFQDQVIQDLTVYAKQAKIEIIGYDFGSSPGAKVAPTKGVATPSNVPPKTLVTVRLQNDIPYTSFLRFLMSIEQNVTKMQLTGLTLQPVDKSPTNVQGPIIELEVFIQ